MYNRNLLIADDDINLLELFKSIFKVRKKPKRGYEQKFDIKTFEDGRYLWEYFQKEYEKGKKIPLCILDMKMTFMDGLETSQKIRSIDPDVMIIIVTAHSDVTSETIRNSLKEDIYYIRKPFKPEEMYCLVDSLIKGWNKNKRLKESEEKYRGIFESLQDIYCRTDMEGIINVISPSIAFLGYKISELNGLPITDIYVRPEENRTLLEELKKYGFINDYELQLYKKDRAIIDVSVNAHFIYDRKRKEPVGIEGLYRDITDRKKAVEELKKYGGRLEDLVIKRTADLTLANNLLREGIAELKKTKEELKKSEERYKLITNTITDYIYTVHLKNGNPVKTEHGASCVAVTGYTSEEFRHNPYLWIQLVYEKDRENVKKYAINIISRKKVSPLEHRIIKKDGTLRWVRNTPVLYYDNRGKLLAYDGLIQDITEQKNAEEILQEQERRFRELFRNLSSGVAVYEAIDNGENFLFKEINRAGERIDRVRKEDITGKPVTSVFSYMKDSALFEALKRVSKSGKSEYLPVSRYEDDNLLEWRENYIYRLPSGEIVVVYDDITERKQMEESLHYRLAIEELVTTISTCFINLSPDIVDREISLALQSIGEFVGVDRSFVINLSLEGETKIENIYEWKALDIKAGDFKDMSLEPFVNILRKLRRFEHLYIPRVADLPSKSSVEKEFLQSLGVLSILVIPMRLGNSLFGLAGFTLERREKVWKEEEVRLLKLVGEIFVSVLERKKAEEEKRELENKLRQSQKMQAIGTLAGGIAHNFNNILAAIVGYTEIMLLDVFQDSDAYFHLNKILESCNRAKEQVQQILAFSNPEERELRPLRVGRVVKETLGLIRASIPSTIEIVQDLEDHYSGIVIADINQIRQVVINLCTNASYAMREKGGILEVRLSEGEITPQNSVLYQGLLPGHYLILSVSDTGCGMKKEIMERVFEPYFTTKKDGRTTGLGLAMVHGIVKSHGGDIMVSSLEGKGSVFRVFLPVRKSSVAGSKVTLKEEKGDKKNILFVDDEKDLVYIAKLWLARLGYKVTAVDSSREAFELFSESPRDFDMVITDQTMPGMTGSDMAQKMLSIRPDIPVILCTGFNDLINPIKAKNLGIREFIMKPFEVEELAGKINEIFNEEEKKD